MRKCIRIHGSSDVDTHIFSATTTGTGGQCVDDDMEADDIRALRHVKQLRLQRLAVAAR
jgi:hypothetical protein